MYVLTGTGLGQIEILDVKRAIRENRSEAKRLGWFMQIDHIVKLIGFSGFTTYPPDEAGFVEAIARWQQNQGLKGREVNGIIDDKTWRLMQIGMGIPLPAPQVPSPISPSRRVLDENDLTDLVFHARHPERNLARLMTSEKGLLKEWNEIRDLLIRPLLQQAPLCKASMHDLQVLADHLRWLNGELKKKTSNPKRLERLRKLIRLQVELIIKLLDTYTKAGCTAPTLKTLEEVLRALPWPKDRDVEEQRDKLINAIQMTQGKAQNLSHSSQRGLAGLGKLITIRQKEVRNLIKARNSELQALIDQVPLPCKVSKGKGQCVFTPVRRETIGGDQHIWALAVTFSSASLADGGKTLGFSPIQNTSKGKTIVTHRILIEINPLRFDSPALKKQIPNDQDRLEFLVSESLFHELIHAVILIERSLPLGTVHTNLFIDFDRMWKTANSTRLSGERSAVRQLLQLLIAFAGVPKANPAADVENHFQFLINEKYAKQMATSAFGHPVDNDQVANSYSKVVAARIESSGTPFHDVKLWNQKVNQLSETVKRLYDKLDIPPEIISPPNYVPVILETAPPIFRLK
jgi:hypothetical protein